MSRLRTGLACLLLVLAVGSTAAAEAHLRLVCRDACVEDGDDQPQPCGDDCGTCACCVVFHLAQPSPLATAFILPAPTVRHVFAEPAPLISREGTDVFHVPKSPLA